MMLFNVRDDPIELVEHLADALEIWQFTACHHQQFSPRSAETIERGGGGVIENTIMREGAVVIAGEREEFHL